MTVLQIWILIDKLVMNCNNTKKINCSCLFCRVVMARAPYGYGLLEMVEEISTPVLPTAMPLVSTQLPLVLLRVTALRLCTTRRAPERWQWSLWRIQFQAVLIL